MAKDNLFEQDINLQGVAKIINLRLDAIASLDPFSPIYNKIGGVYFNTEEDSVRVKTADGWYSTVLYNGGLDENQVLCVFKPNEYNKVERFITREVAPRLLAIDVDSSPYLVEFVNFTNFLDPGIFVDSVINNDTRLVTSNAVYDYVATAISGLSGDYLPLAGGTMSGSINMGTNAVSFGDYSAYISGNTTLSLMANAINIFFSEGGEFNFTNAGFVPGSKVDFSASQNGYLGYVVPFIAGYITNIYTSIVSGNGASLTLLGGAYNDTKVEIGGDQVTFYDHLYPSSTVTKDIGSGSTRWRNGYFSRLDAFQLYVNSTTAYVNEIVTTIDLVTPSNYAIATESAVANLFGTIETITGVAITNMESVGMVTRYSGASASDYVLTAADTWVHKNTLNYWELELISGTTYKLELTDDYDIATFEFVTNSAALDNNLVLGVRGGYLMQLSYDGRMRMYLGNTEPALTTEGAHVIEILADTRIQSDTTLFFGGTGLTRATVGFSYAANEYDGIGVVPTIRLKNGALYAEEGISTDGDNLWEFYEPDVGTSITASNLLIVSVNGNYYKIAAQKFTPT